MKKSYVLLLLVIFLTGCQSAGTGSEGSGAASGYSESAQTTSGEESVGKENPDGPHPEELTITIDGANYEWTPVITVFAVKDGSGYNLTGVEYEYSRYVDEYSTLEYLGKGDEFGVSESYSLYKTSDGNVFVTYKCPDVSEYADSAEWLKDYSEDMFFEGFVYKAK